MTKTVQEMVTEFHQVFGHPVTDVVTDLSVSHRQLRLDLIKEEFDELVTASGFKYYGYNYSHEEGSIQDPVEMADALGDLAYVIYGFALSMGIDLDRVVEEIHRSNMTKLGEDGKPIICQCRRASDPTHSCDESPEQCEPTHAAPIGKIIKGPNYQAPDISAVIFF